SGPCCSRAAYPRTRSTLKQPASSSPPSGCAPARSGAPSPGGPRGSRAVLLVGEAAERSRAEPGSAPAPLAARLDGDDDERAGRRLVAVLRVLGLQQLERPGVVLDHARAAREPHPPQARPVLVPVVDHDLDPWVRLDVREP